MLKITNESTSHPEITHLESGKTFKFPHGSGINSNWDWEFDEELCLSLHNYYHAMDNNGMYCGYVHFEVIISFVDGKFGFDVTVSQDDIDNIIANYEETVNEYGEIETNAPYLDGLQDYLYQTIYCENA